jgi:hypothetical protein
VFMPSPIVASAVSHSIGDGMNTLDAKQMADTLRAFANVLSPPENVLSPPELAGDVRCKCGAVATIRYVSLANSYVCGWCDKHPNCVPADK